ncbi:hypothetical protein BpHYR1_024986 [Brachionus plicatilis]|uniref:Uncharacterized protein n=1 Tax=Brachionus plicatilis TaxID=10195 RepID=A0A3M7RUZ9_BRAPC|nr:hypothetical protein BpHYR1_024986 [Brachionus plicatilis]
MSISWCALDSKRALIFNKFLGFELSRVERIFYFLSLSLSGRSFPITGRNLEYRSEPEQNGKKYLLDQTQKGSFNDDGIVYKWHQTNPFRESV